MDLNDVDAGLRDRYFDAILLIQVLEHLPNPIDILRKLSALLKPNGKLYVSVPMSQSVHQVPFDYYRYTPYGLRYIGSEAGLRLSLVCPQEAGDLESNIRRFIWSITYAESFLAVKYKLSLFFLKTFCKIIRNSMRFLDNKSKRHIHPIGYVAIYSKS